MVVLAQIKILVNALNCFHNITGKQMIFPQQPEHLMTVDPDEVRELACGSLTQRQIGKI